MATRTTEFRNRLLSQRTVWSAGAYDALSALMIERAKFDAVFSAGGMISASYLGLPDAELYTMTENLTVVRNMCSAVQLPVIADTDTGYGNAMNVMRTVREFEAAGVAAVIFEDQVSPKRCPSFTDSAELLPVDEACGKLRAAVAARKDANLVIIARTDARDPQAAIARARAYVEAGADMIQPISKTFKDIEGLRALREGCGVPLSLVIASWAEGLSPAEVESVAGLASFPLVPLMTVVEALRENLEHMSRSHSVGALPRGRYSHDQFGELIGFRAIQEQQKLYLPAS